MWAEPSTIRSPIRVASALSDKDKECKTESKGDDYHWA